MDKSLLLIDDDPNLLRVTSFQLEQAGYQVQCASDAAQGLEIFKQKSIDLILTDINMPGMTGLELIKTIRQNDPAVPVIVITAYGSLDNAIKTTQSGASDYLTKPFSIEALTFAIEKNLRIRHLDMENEELRRQLFDKYLPENIIGQSGAMKQVMSLIEKSARSDANVLILGESGTGKELVARAIHHLSKRRPARFIAVNCASIPRELMESELFGHTRGAFTGAVRDKTGKFEAAEGGTLFLDEIGDLDPDLQAKLLRVLQDREIQRIGENRNRPIDVRVLTATHRNLEKAIAAGRFRQDLYYRINVLPLTIPPLRQRREDIPLLVSHFIQKLERSRRIRITDEAMRKLVHCDWPGNVRELENLIERLSILYAGQPITAGQLPLSDPIVADSGGQLILPFPDEGIGLNEIEKKVIEEALKRNQYNQSRTAAFLKIPRHVLLYRIKKLKIGQ